MQDNIDDSMRLRSDLRHAREALETMGRNLRTAIEQRDEAHARIAHGKTKAWRLIEVHQSLPEEDRHPDMQAAVDAYMDEQRHWLNDDRGEDDDGCR